MEEYLAAHRDEVEAAIGRRGGVAARRPAMDRAFHDALRRGLETFGLAVPAEALARSSSATPTGSSPGTGR